MSQIRYQKYLESLQNTQKKLEKHQADKEITSQGASLRLGKKPRNLREWQAVIDEQIQQAMDAGEFDNLSGAGKPLDLGRNPYVDLDQEMANRLLKNNDYAPEWIERDKEIREDIDLAREKLVAAWQRYQQHLSNDIAWQNAITRFETALEEINRKISAYNLVVPILSKQRGLLRMADELARIGCEK